MQDRDSLDHSRFAEITRRGMAAIEDGLRHGPVHIVKRNKPAAVVLTEAEYQRLAHGRVTTPSGITAVQWLLNQHTAGKRSKAQSWRRRGGGARGNGCPHFALSNRLAPDRESILA